MMFCCKESFEFSGCKPRPISSVCSLVSLNLAASSSCRTCCTECVHFHNHWVSAHLWQLTVTDRIRTLVVFHKLTCLKDSSSERQWLSNALTKRIFRYFFDLLKFSPSSLAHSSQPCPFCERFSWHTCSRDVPCYTKPQLEEHHTLVEKRLRGTVLEQGVHLIAFLLSLDYMFLSARTFVISPDHLQVCPM